MYDYSAGKVDWLAAGEATEGTNIPTDRVISAIKRDVPTCGLADRAGPAIKAAVDEGWSLCVVVAPVPHGSIVAGRLRAKHVDPGDQRLAEEVMEPGPATVRAHADLKETRERMAAKHVSAALVTTPQGELLGALTLS